MNNFKSKKVLVVSAVFAVVFFTVSSVIFLNNNQQKKLALALNSSSHSNSDSSSIETLQSSSKSDSSTSSSSIADKSSSIVVNISSSKNVASIATENNISLVGGKCNGLDINNVDPYTGYCRIIDRGHEISRIYFNQTQSSLQLIQGSTFQPQANGYFYVEKLKKTDSVQYIRWVYGSEYIVYGGVIYSYDFKTQKLSNVEKLYFQGLNFPGQSPHYMSYERPECTNINLPTFWDYSCFYMSDNHMEPNQTERYILSDTEKAHIDKTKKDCLYYIQKAPIYGLPSLLR